MREILFRGKSIVADSPNTPGHWLEGCYISRLLDFEDGKTVIEHNIIERSSYINIYLDMCTEVWPETVGQFTGLLDKNGKKIFEGDIVSELWEWREKGEENYYIVRWDNGSCGFEPFSDSLENCGHCGGGINPKECEVIGNIHDNPDLMVDNNTVQIERMAEYMKKMTTYFMKSST